MKKTVIVALLISSAAVAFADRGAGKKAKAKTNLNINTTINSSLKASILNNLKKGLVYKGSFVTTAKPSVNTNVASSNILVTYQKGNTTYIIPYKKRVAAVPDIQQGYTGVKLIIRPKH